MKIGSLFSGIGGLELGLERAGLGQTVWQVEIDPYCRAVLENHWPDVKRFKDVREIRADQLEKVEIVCGGFPCQDVSAAGAGIGISGSRSGLWREFARLVEELRPSIVIIENVASAKRRWLPTVQSDLHMLGYHSTAYALSAADVGAPHLRRRVFVVAYAGRSWASWQDTSITQFDGSKRDAESLGNTDSARRSRRQEEPNERRAITSDRSWWAIEPDVGRVAHGLSGGMDGRKRRARLRALGNAVVPQCAEVIGRLIRESIIQ